MIRTRYIAAASFLFTIAFFIEYTPLFPKVHIPFDLEGYHYPLADYAFQAIHQGRFPQWDPTIYSGLSFTGNTQVGLFYPPTWLMFAFNRGRSRLSYQSMEDLAIAHVWCAFFLCYLWLRRQRGLHPLASVLGAGVFAFSGYMLLQMQHLGLIAGYAWIPLGFQGIDAADQTHNWRPLWMLVVASAMCFLAGYPTTWVVFCVCMIAYAGVRKGALRNVSWVGCALAASLVVSAIQLLPALEAAHLKAPEAKFGHASGMRDPEFFVSYFFPNYFNFGQDVPVETNPGQDYLYLGAPALAGLALLFWRKRFAGVGPPLAVLLTSLLLVVNPYGLLGLAIEHSFLAQVLSGYYFLAGVTAAVALLAALGLDYALRRESRPARPWLGVTAMILALAWSARLIKVWMAGGNTFAIGWLSGFDALVAAVLFGFLIAVFPCSSRRLRVCTAAALLILAASEYKAFGTSKRFNASQGRVHVPSEPIVGLNTSVYQSLRLHPEFRVALDPAGPFPPELRHVGLTTPQGFDPFVPEQYRALLEQSVAFRTNREFDLKPEDEPTLRLLGVRYFMTSEPGSLYGRLSSNPHFQQLQPADGYYRVFELADPSPAFGWEVADTGHSVELKVWQPERRGFIVNSSSGGLFRLSEQFFPGWNATVDRVETSVESCHLAFQCILLPPGQHLVEFRYHSRWLALGGAISFCSILLLAKVVRAQSIRP